jgi:hypothetical protein
MIGKYMTNSPTLKLIQTLDEIINILQSDDETHWCDWMTKARDRLLHSDYSEVEYLLSAYGGMGSFNDLVICQSAVDGKFKWKDGYKEKNSRLDELRQRAYELANGIKRNHEIVGS